VTDLRGGRKTFTHDELDGIVRGFASSGTPFDFIAGFIESDNRPHCTDQSERE
jgi:hypothetical protein